MHNYCLVLSYIGFNYKGWQIQNDLKTVQGTLIETLEKVLEIKIEKSSYTGRTDKLVSALFQYFNFFTTKDIQITSQLINKINSFLPEDMFVIDFRKVQPSFSSRYSARFKQYLYKLVPFKEYEYITEKYGLRNFLPIKEVSKDFLINKLENFVPFFNGLKDYASYYKPDKEVKKNTVLDLQTNYFFYDFPEFFVLTLEFKAAYFLRNMIRKIVGMFLAYLDEKVDLEYIKDSFDNPCPCKGKFLAPSEPLVLYYVEY